MQVRGIAVDACEDMVALAGAALSTLAGVIRSRGAVAPTATATRMQPRARAADQLSSADLPSSEVLPVMITGISVRGIDACISSQGPHYAAAPALAGHVWPSGHILASRLVRRHALVQICLPELGVEALGIGVWRRDRTATSLEGDESSCSSDGSGNPALHLLAVFVGGSGCAMRGPHSLRATASELTVSHPVALVPEDDGDSDAGVGVTPRPAKPGVPLEAWGEGSEESVTGVSDEFDDVGDGDARGHVQEGEAGLRQRRQRLQFGLEQSPAPMHEAVYVRSVTCAWQALTVKPTLMLPLSPAADPAGSAVIDLVAGDVSLIFSDEAFPSLAAAVRATTCWQLRYITPALHMLRNARDGVLPPDAPVDVGFGPVRFRRIFQARGDSGEWLGYAGDAPPAYHVLRGVPIPSQTVPPAPENGASEPAGVGGFCSLAALEPPWEGTDLASGPPRRHVWHHHSCAAAAAAVAAGGGDPCACHDAANVAEAACAEAAPPLLPKSFTGMTRPSVTAPAVATFGPGRARYPLQGRISRITILSALRLRGGGVTPPAILAAASVPGLPSVLPPRLPWHVFSIESLTVAADVAVPGPRAAPRRLLRLAPCALAGTHSAPPLADAQSVSSSQGSTVRSIRRLDAAAPAGERGSRSSRTIPSTARSTSLGSSRTAAAPVPITAPNGVISIDVPYSPPDAFCMVFAGITVDAVLPPPLHSSDGGGSSADSEDRDDIEPPPPAARTAPVVLAAARSLDTPSAVHRALSVERFSVDMNVVPLLRAWAPPGAGEPSKPPQLLWQPLVDLSGRGVTVSLGSNPEQVAAIVHGVRSVISYVPNGLVSTIQRAAASRSWAEHALRLGNGGPAPSVLRLSDALRFTARSANPPSASAAALAQVRFDDMEA